MFPFMGLRALSEMFPFILDIELCAQSLTGESLTFRPFAAKREYQLYYKFIFCAGMKTVLPAVLSIGFTVKLIQSLRQRQVDNELCLEREMQMFRSPAVQEEEGEEGETEPVVSNRGLGEEEEGRGIQSLRRRQMDNELCLEREMQMFRSPAVQEEGG